MAYTQGAYWKVKKDGEIKKAMERKEASIQKYTDLKSVSINITSSFNSASDLATALVAKGDLELDNYWERHEELYSMFLSRLEGEHEKGKKEFYEALMGKGARKVEQKDLALDTAAHEAADDAIVEAGEINQNVIVN